MNRVKQLYFPNKEYVGYNGLFVFNYKSSFRRPPASCIFSPGLNAGIPKYGQVAHRNASPK